MGVAPRKPPYTSGERPSRPFRAVSKSASGPVTVSCVMLSPPSVDSQTPALPAPLFEPMKTIRNPVVSAASAATGSLPRNVNTPAAGISVEKWYAVQAFAAVQVRYPKSCPAAEPGLTE